VRKRRPRPGMPNVVDNTRLSDVLVFIVVRLSIVAKVTEDILHEIAFKNAVANDPDTVRQLYFLWQLEFGFQISGSFSDVRSESWESVE
jgi:hypothetical protein